MKRNYFSIFVTFFIINMIGVVYIILEQPIGSIILIFSGLITYTNPKKIHDSNITSILYIRYGSLIIFLGGIFNLIFIEIIPHIIFNYVYKEHLQTILLTFIFMGIALIAGEDYIVGSKKSSTFTRTTIESMVCALIPISIFIGAMAYIIRYEPFTIVAFCISFFTGFSIIICPNALDINQRTKFSRLLMRLFGIMIILMTIIIYIIVFFNISFILRMTLYVMLIIILFLASIALAYSQYKELKHKRD